MIHADRKPRRLITGVRLYRHIPEHPRFVALGILDSISQFTISSLVEIIVGNLHIFRDILAVFISGLVTRFIKRLTQLHGDLVGSGQLQHRIHLVRHRDRPLCRIAFHTVLHRIFSGFRRVQITVDLDLFTVVFTIYLHSRSRLIVYTVETDDHLRIPVELDGRLLRLIHDGKSRHRHYQDSQDKDQDLTLTIPLHSLCMPRTLPIILSFQNTFSIYFIRIPSQVCLLYHALPRL